MTITNGYATLADFTARYRKTSANGPDDAVIEGLIESASRLIDAETSRWFYASTQTREFDVPDCRELRLDAPLLAVTTLTNGDGTVIAASEYVLSPRNVLPAYAIRLKATSTVTWMPGADGATEGAIGVAGSWGWVSRSATDPESMRVIGETKEATLEIASLWYAQRFGENVGGQVQVTQAGVVITQSGAIPQTAYNIIARLRNKF